MSLAIGSAIENEQLTGSWRDFYEITPNDETVGRFQVISFNWDEVQKPYTIAIWLLLAGIAKMGLFFFFV
ncbi:unnamed protein product [Onchocerca flexuosa]|uniref:Neur_chan_LBD domain-containing protein n=1 Tax=Onchocerca flexuosa TaxID=387005 RepID=A0A183I7S3_9BILA|nr:unnamed protein product [Onchocerca flexuosa]